MKMTKREKFEMLKAIPEVANNPMLVEFIDHELDILARKNSGERKPTASQMVNEGIKDAIVEFLEKERKAFTITELIKLCPACQDASNQRINALVRQMMPERVERVKGKDKAMVAGAGVIQTEEVGEYTPTAKKKGGLNNGQSY